MGFIVALIDSQFAIHLHSIGIMQTMYEKILGESQKRSAGTELPILACSIIFLDQTF